LAAIGAHLLLPWGTLSLDWQASLRALQQAERVRQTTEPLRQLYTGPNMTYMF
jgi:hypothetical protein